MTTTMTLSERFRQTHPFFQAKIKRLAALTNCTVLRVYELWREYSEQCSNYDQSALLWEFVQWYQPQLGADLETMRTAVN